MKKGFTLIETLIAVSIMAAVSIGLLKLFQSSYNEKLISNFEYNYSKIIKGFEIKLLEEEQFDKKYWTYSSFDKNTYQSHLFRNLISKKRQCDKFDYLSLDNKSFINCLDVVSFNVFKTNFNGNIFYDQNEFQYYQIDFKPKTNKDFLLLKKLQSSLKNIFNKTDLYSNIYFYNGNTNVSYLKCVKTPTNCSLRLNFGARYDYLEKKVINIQEEKKEIIKREQSQFNIDEYKPKTQEKSNINISNNSKSKIKKQLNEYGLEVNNKQLDQIQKQLTELRNNPTFMKNLTEQMELYCSQYDEDDYYFMSLYETDNKCYQFKKNGIQ